MRDVIRELGPDAFRRDIHWRIGDLPTVRGDAALLRIVVGNLIANALKFTRPDSRPTSKSGHDREVWMND